MKTEFKIHGASKISSLGLFPVCANLAVTLDRVLRAIGYKCDPLCVEIDVGFFEDPAITLKNFGPPLNVCGCLAGESFGVIVRLFKARIYVNEKTGEVLANLIKAEGEKSDFSGTTTVVTEWLADVILKQLRTQV